MKLTEDYLILYTWCLCNCLGRKIKMSTIIEHKFKNPGANGKLQLFVQVELEK